MNELESMDEQMNEFLREQALKKVVSVSDTGTTDDTGVIIGLIRVMPCEV